MDWDFFFQDGQIFIVFLLVRKNILLPGFYLYTFFAAFFGFSKKKGEFGRVGEEEVPLSFT